MLQTNHQSDPKIANKQAKANRHSLVKRAFDYFVALILLVVFSPLITLIALAIKIIDRRGSVFFVQYREGIHGTSFPFFKFRTMYVDADERLTEHLSQCPRARAEWQDKFHLANDPRVLPILGNLLRKTSLDELPNLINVLRGELSLVGPRPFPTYHLDSFDQQFRSLRASVRPGLTCWWQIYRGNLVAQRYWDEQYINNWSFLEDVWIFLRTAPVVVTARHPLFSSSPQRAEY